MISYQQEQNVTVTEFRQILVESTLGERRPVDDFDRLQQMLDHANLLVTARDNGKLVGLSRSLTDHAFCTYLSDLAVHEDYQKQGIGRELIRLTKRLSPAAKLILLAAPKAVGYYPKIGMQQWEHCYCLDNPDDLH